MLLDSVTDPDDLRKLDAAELTALASEIRSCLVESVSASGGHLGSNLGVVELTIALHRTFQSPVDAILWDVGHQAYVHKLLTGRRDGFARLRQAGGLSGYPSRAESVHDLVENSHASTACAYACGLAEARRSRGEPGSVVAVVGDGALTGGLTYEALGNIGQRGVPVVVVCNDNGRSYAPTVTPLSAPDRMQRFAEALGFDYRGPIDGHDLASLEAALGAAADPDGPVFVHVRTVKGRGYRPAEDDPVKCLHDVGPFDAATGKTVGAEAPTWTQAFAEAMVGLGRDRSDVVAVTAAMPGSTGLLPFAERYPDRFYDVGIAEQQAVASAAGMAMGGLRPVVAIYSTFLNRAWDQVYYDVGLHRLPVVFCVDRAGITGDDGASHHGVLDLALLSKVPGMTVLAPSSAAEVDVMLRHALELDGPVAIRWPKGAAPADAPPGTGHALTARRLRVGADVAVLAVGKLVTPAMHAARRLADAGIETSVWDVRCCAPLDGAMFDDAARHPVVVTVEDGIADGGIGSAIALGLAASSAPTPEVRVLGTPTEYLDHDAPDAILARLGLDSRGIAASIAAAVSQPAIAG